MSFHVGQKVVCVDDDLHDEWHHGSPDVPLVTEHIRRGQIYIVRRTMFRKMPLIWLCGINRKTVEWFDSGFHASRFRPITERKTDIEIFRRLLVPGTKIVEPA